MVYFKNHGSFDNERQVEIQVEDNAGTDRFIFMDDDVTEEKPGKCRKAFSRFRTFWGISAAAAIGILLFSVNSKKRER